MNAGRDDRALVKEGVRGGREQLEVSDSGLVCASNEGLAVRLKTLLHLLDNFVHVSSLSPLFASFVGEGLAQDAGEEVAVEPAHGILTKVEHGVDLVASLGVLRVVTEANAKSAEDSVGSANGHAVLLPNGHAAEGEPARVLDSGEVGERDALVGVLETSMMKHGADSISTTIDVEVNKSSWHFIFLI